MEWRDVENGTKRVTLMAEDVLQILKRISDRDAEILGFNPKFSRPEWMICTVLPVPPPSVRPSVRTDTGQRQEDDLTHKLLMIVKVNKNLQQKLEKVTDKTNAEQQIDMWTTLLQYEVATMIDNTHPSIPTAQQKTGRPIRSLTERLKSKEGRIRGNLMGKRVDYSARSVITPDPNLSIDELGVPTKIAMNMTYPEIVTKFNIEEMTKVVRNGPDVYPGAKHIKSISTGITKRLKNLDRASIKLEIGDVVERHIRNGDYVLFNRQPSLHKLSMQAFRVRVMPYQTFRLNVCVTPSFNADFDGDEMNAIFSIGLQSMEELIQLCPVPTQIISPRDSKPITAVVQDVATGLFRMTKNHVRINERQMMNILSNTSKFNGIMPDAYEMIDNSKYWTGRQAISTILPDRINVDIKTDNHHERNTVEENENFIINVKNGELVGGALSKDVFQARTRGVVHSVFTEYGPEETRQLFDNTQKMICDWLVYDGFSTGISDLIISDATENEFKNIIRDLKVKVYDVIRSIHESKFENNSTKNNADLFEERVRNDYLNTANSEVGNKALSQISDRYNRLINMIKSKSKGNTVNIAQMIGCVGQQNVEGRRIPYGFDDRTLPHYTKYDDGPESRGFVENSFIKGLTPQEFFFHAMGGREGLIDTAVQTSETGYIQRKLVKAMEDCKVNHDMTVRNAGGVIVQYLYGEDGMDSCKLDSQTIPHIQMETDALVANYSLVDGINDFKGFVNSEIWKELSANNQYVSKRMEEHFDQVIADREHVIVKINKGKSEASFMYPVSLQKILVNFQNMYSKYNANIPGDLSPLYVLDKLDDICKECVVSKNYHGNMMFQILLRSYITPKRIIITHRLTKNAFDSVVEQIKYRFYEALVNPSEMVGVIAAQSIGEISTQLVLNTFHASGTSAASKATKGVPRLNELLAVSKKIKTPIMRIYLKSDVNRDKKMCLSIMNDIRTVRFKDIITSSRIYFDPDDFNTNIVEDRGFINAYKTFLNSEEADCVVKTSSWLLRFEFDRDKLQEYKLDMMTLHYTLSSFYDDSVSCMYSDDNAQQLVMRVRLTLADNQASDDMLTDLKALEHNIIENLVIKGVKLIQRAALEEKRGRVYCTKEEMNKDKSLGKHSQYNKITGTFEDKKEWIIYTEGTNLRDVLALSIVDAPFTMTNDVNEVYEVLGIEAARQALYNELMDVIDGNNVNYRHITLLVDVMTNRGTILSVNRHGINRGDIGPLAKCSFEETTDKLIKAGIFAEYDKINGVSANVMLGQIAPCGTGDVDVIMDEEMLMQMQPMQQTNKRTFVIDDEDTSSACAPDVLKIDMPTVKVEKRFDRKTDNEIIFV